MDSLSFFCKGTHCQVTLFLPLDDGEPGCQHSSLLVVPVSPLSGSWGMEKGTRREAGEKGTKQ